MGENLFVGFFYIEHMAGHVVENYSKSLQKLEDGIIRMCPAGNKGDFPGT